MRSSDCTQTHWINPDGGSRNLCFNKPSRSIECTWKSANHCHPLPLQRFLILAICLGISKLLIEKQGVYSLDIKLISYKPKHMAGRLLCHKPLAVIREKQPQSQVNISLDGRDGEKFPVNIISYIVSYMFTYPRLMVPWDVQEKDFQVWNREIRESVLMVLIAPPLPTACLSQRSAEADFCLSLRRTVPLQAGWS